MCPAVTVDTSPRETWLDAFSCLQRAAMSDHGVRVKCICLSRQACEVAASDRNRRLLERGTAHTASESTDPTRRSRDLTMVPLDGTVCNVVRIVIRYTRRVARRLGFGGCPLGCV
jgi:hypothetical protein